MIRGDRVPLILPFPMDRIRGTRKPTIKVRYICGQLEAVCPKCRRHHLLERVA